MNWLLDRLLAKLVRQGRLTVIDHDGSRKSYGEPAPGFGTVTVRFADKGTARKIVTDPRIGAGEAYMDGRLIIEQGDVRDLAMLIRANNSFEKGGHLKARGPVRRGTRVLLQRIDRMNWHRRSRRNVAHHYDLSDRLYDLFLDRDRQYSCAYFDHPDDDLEIAQHQKIAHILAKLHLKPGVSTLDIGCGWGGTALAINRITGGEVLGITLSEEQLKVAQRRAEEAGVAAKVRFKLIDYRDVDGQFDRIVSVGMFEHVGPPNYRHFFGKCRNLLARDGVMLLHTIGRMGGPGSTDLFTSKYIFPGGYIPALSEIVRGHEGTGLIAADIETLRVHYGHTIDRWYDRTVAAKEAIVDLYDERFYRLWIYYLAGAGSVFHHGGMCNYQLQYIRDRRALPITRDYLAEDEAGLREALG